MWRDRKLEGWGLGIYLQWPEGESSKTAEREKQTDIEKRHEAMIGRGRGTRKIEQVEEEG